MQLIKIDNAPIGNEVRETVNAKELHSFLEVGKGFAAWIGERIESFGFTENQDFVVLSESGQNPKGGRPAKDYFITLDMAKELSMVERNAKGKIARQYFIECEKRTMAIPQDPIIMIRMEQLTMQKQLAGQQDQISAVSAKVDKLKPKITASALNKLQGAISHAAKVYRLAQGAKHIKLSVNESSIYFQMMLLDAFDVADIGYIEDLKAAHRLLKKESVKHEADYDAWLERNSLFHR